LRNDAAGSFATNRTRPLFPDQRPQTGDAVTVLHDFILPPSSLRQFRFALAARPLES
jgi:hypothetical protein